eukprot:365609-Chlamydomonas_euryale.AAC.9
MPICEAMKWNYGDPAGLLSSKILSPPPCLPRPAPAYSCFPASGPARGRCHPKHPHHPITIHTDVPIATASSAELYPVAPSHSSALLYVALHCQG